MGTCVPREISDEMPDVVRFYRMNAQNIKLFYPMGSQFFSLISMSDNHPFVSKTVGKGRRMLSNFFRFYAESRSLCRLDTFHIANNKEVAHTFPWSWYKSSNIKQNQSR